MTGDCLSRTQRSILISLSTFLIEGKLEGISEELVLVEQVRDQSLSRLKSQIELMYLTNGNKKVVVVPHSMGVIYFLHFLKWVETPPPVGGGGGPNWCAKHIKSVMNIGPAFLGVPKAVSNIISNEVKDVATLRLAFELISSQMVVVC